MSRAIQFLVFVLLSSVDVISCGNVQNTKASSLQEVVEEVEWHEADAIWYLMEPDFEFFCFASLSTAIGALLFAAFDAPVDVGASAGFIVGGIPLLFVCKYRKIIRLMKAYHKIGRMKTITCE